MPLRPGKSTSRNFSWKKSLTVHVPQPYVVGLSLLSETGSNLDVGSGSRGQRSPSCVAPGISAPMSI